jgi:serine protease AprX
VPDSLPPQIIDLLLLGAPDRRRQLQDLPVLGDVWSQFALLAGSHPDLLILPSREHSAAEVATFLQDPGESQNPDGDRSVAWLEGIVVATLTLDDLIAHVLPYTSWWDGVAKKLSDSGAVDAALPGWIADEVRTLVPKGHALTEQLAKQAKAAPNGSAQQAARLGVLLGTFLTARVEYKMNADEGEPPARPGSSDPQAIFGEEIGRLGAERVLRAGAEAIARIRAHHAAAKRSATKRGLVGAIFQVTMNRPAEAAGESISAIKADAARSLFAISCAKLAWAVVDSGIDHTHPAFRDHSKTKADEHGLPPHRIRESFDFTRIRAILGVKKAEITDLAAEIVEKTGIKPADARKNLEKIIADREAKSPVDWHNIEPLIRLKLTSARKVIPGHAHGTHVAGILGADLRKDEKSGGGGDTELKGVCPDIWLYDFRVLGSDLGDSEFAVSAALQFIRNYNEQSAYQRIHGVNMSLAIRHNVRNYACGQTPVCKQAEALVLNGVAVVAAAGNRGYMQYQLADQTVYEGYAASSITDPGNADGVITVGATHRSWPHTYGVSFFSSRGPTGDGRLKPDLLAPGEKIESCVPGGGMDVMDGTSMAAPHVSGAAALLMARHEELKGRPTRIKEILCSTATDLKRERHFQGHGMVDVLRAIQSV